MKTVTHITKDAGNGTIGFLVDVAGRLYPVAEGMIYKDGRVVMCLTERIYKQLSSMGWKDTNNSTVECREVTRRLKDASPDGLQWFFNWFKRLVEVIYEEQIKRDIANGRIK